MLLRNGFCAEPTLRQFGTGRIWEVSHLDISNSQPASQLGGGEGVALPRTGLRAGVEYIFLLPSARTSA